DPGRDRAGEAALRLPAGGGAVQVRVRARHRGGLRGEDPVTPGGALRVAMLSVHTCPLAALGGKETGGMNVYVRELSRELGRMGVEVDVFTRSQNPSIPRVVPLGDRARVVHLAAGPEAPMPRAEIHAHLDEFVDGVDTARFTPGDRAAARAALSLDERPVLLWVGRIAPIKGLDTLLDAIARLRAGGAALTLLIVGGEADEPENGHEAELRERIERLGLGAAVRFVGPLPQDVLPTYYVAADVTVLPSYYESFGMV